MRSKTSLAHTGGGQIASGNRVLLGLPGGGIGREAALPVAPLIEKSNGRGWERCVFRGPPAATRDVQQRLRSVSFPWPSAIAFLTAVIGLGFGGGLEAGADTLRPRRARERLPGCARRRSRRPPAPGPVQPDPTRPARTVRSTGHAGHCGRRKHHGTGAAFQCPLHRRRADRPAQGADAPRPGYALRGDRQVPVQPARIAGAAPTSPRPPPLDTAAASAPPGERPSGPARPDARSRTSP
jgi:hypothetical protein